MMKLNYKFALAAAVAFCGFVPLSRATITINFTAGDLRNSSGVLMPVGGLLEIVADTSRNGFSQPTTTSFTSGDDLVIASFTLNGNFNGAGTTQNALNYNPANFSGLDAGDPLIFRWFPTLTASSTAPGAGAMYGQFSATTNQDGSNLTPPWTEQTDGGTFTLNFVTVNEGGANANSTGFANFTVVPEPSTLALLAGMMAGGAGLYARRRRV